MGRTNKNSVSNEEIITALLQHGTIKEAAQAVNLAPRTIYDRMNEREFRAEYATAKAEIIRKAVIDVNSRLSAAIGAVFDIMEDKDNNAAVRLQAAQTIINTAAKFADRLNTAETTARSEDRDIFNIF